MDEPKAKLLVVGKSFQCASAILRQAEQAGWSHRTVASVAEARRAIKIESFDIVLAREELPDGLGYDLIPSLDGGRSSLFVAVALTGNCLWLPAVEEGTKCLGATAFGPEEIFGRVQQLLFRRVLRAGEEKGEELESTGELAS